MSITAKELYDATMRGEGILAKHTKLNPDMPVFLLIGQDTHAADLVDVWVIRTSIAVPSAGGGEAQHKLGEARVIAEQMRHWPIHKNPD